MVVSLLASAYGNDPRNPMCSAGLYYLVTYMQYKAFNFRHALATSRLCSSMDTLLRLSE
jgi:hypothetical protein